jgi:hypothetical protein
MCTLDKRNGNIVTLSIKTQECYLPVLTVVPVPGVMNLEEHHVYTYKEKDTDAFHLTRGS